jgi:hypothetical protein
MPPSLPSRPTKDPDKLSASWLCKLLDCVAYGMSNPRGDGKTILNESAGTLRALRQPGGGSDGGAAAPYTLFEVVMAEGLETYVQINGYNPGKDRYYNNWCVFGLNRVEVLDGEQISVESTGVIYLEATYPVDTWVVTPKYSAGLPKEDATKRIRYLADVIMSDGKITAINQPPTGVMYFPSWLDNYDVTKKMALIVNEGNWEFVEIGDCNA